MEEELPIKQKHKRAPALALCAAVLCLAAACAPAQSGELTAALALIPLPNGKTEIGDGHITLPDPLVVDPGEFAPEFFEVYAQRAGIALSIEKDNLSFLRVSLDESLQPEGYRLRVTEQGIEIAAADEQGLCWALVSLAALTQDGGVPICEIEDAPYYTYRGFLMDSARHFFPVETIKALIELTSMVKMNAFHWHLTDDQGWRVESLRFPLLQEQNVIPGEYYTQEEIREVIEFARVRGVEVIPEIDLPGHATAIMAAYPALSCSEKAVRVADYPGIRSVILCAGKEAVFDLLYPLLEEMAALFPSPNFHLGGDEAPKVEWEKCPHCLRRMEEEGLAGVDELQGWFTARLARHLRGFGKRVTCWNESLLSEHLQEEIQDLRIEYWAEVHETGAVRRFWERGGGMIFAEEFAAHFDLPYGAISLKKVYNYRPAALGFKGADADKLPTLGLEACIWTEFVETEERLALLTFPRTYATAEAAWTRPDLREYGSFRGRLDLWLARYPGIGFTPPQEADLRFVKRIQNNAEFLRKLATALDKENPDNAGAGGRLHWRYLAHWIGNYFLY